MADEARRVAVTTSDEGSFRAFDLNQAVEPTKEMVCTVSGGSTTARVSVYAGRC